MLIFPKIYPPPFSQKTLEKSLLSKEFGSWFVIQKSFRGKVVAGGYRESDEG